MKMVTYFKHFHRKITDTWSPIFFQQFSKLKSPNLQFGLLFILLLFGFKKNENSDTFGELTVTKANVKYITCAEYYVYELQL